MKNLKKFNENWINDETEDTNRRMSELDNNEEEGINKPEEHIKDEDAENALIYAARDYVQLYGREKLEELLNRLLPLGEHKKVIR